MSRRRPQVGAAMLTLVLAACGGTTETLAPGPQPAPSTTAATTTAPEPVAAAAPEPGSPLARRDAVPEGVAAQFSFLQLTDGCDLEVTVNGRIVGADHVFLAGDDILLCVTPRDAAVEVIRADGTPAPLEPDKLGRQLALGLFDPAGTYAVTVTSAGTTVVVNFSVQKPDGRRVKILDPDVGPPGTAFDFQVLGLTPDEVVFVDVYGPANGGCAYVTTIPVPTDGDGHAVSAVDTATTDEPGAYCLHARGSTLAAYWTFRLA